MNAEQGLLGRAARNSREVLVRLLPWCQMKRHFAQELKLWSE